MIVTSDFVAPRWASNQHLQTIWPRFFVSQPSLQIRWEKLATDDGDFIELAWHQQSDNKRGLVVIFHGLEGSVDSHYASLLMADLASQGWNSVMVHFRGCGPSGNQTARSYHSGETADNWLALQHIYAQNKQTSVVAIGYSLGGNMLLKLLGEQGQNPYIRQAIAVSPPFDLAMCSRAISQGFSRFYEKHLLKSMRQKFVVKYHQYDYSKLLGMAFDEIAQLDSFFAFDDRITGPLHGFDGAEHYYQTCSARSFMSNIATPTLVLHAKDDPFMTPEIVPDPSLLSASVTIELSEQGGHVGFLQGAPWQPELWVNKRVLQLLHTLY